VSTLTKFKIHALSSRVSALT